MAASAASKVASGAEAHELVGVEREDGIGSRRREASRAAVVMISACR
jgi:hypothetical protein